MVRLTRRGFIGGLVAAAVSAVARFSPLTVVAEQAQPYAYAPRTALPDVRFRTVSIYSAASWFAALDPEGRSEHYWQDRVDSRPSGIGLARETPADLERRRLAEVEAQLNAAFARREQRWMLLQSQMLRGDFSERKA